MNIALQKNGAQAVVRTHGAELISWKDASGTEYLWSGDAKYWPGINPILFPIVGGLKDGQIQLDGACFGMNRHGFARDMEFQLIEQSEAEVVLELCENAESLVRYPRKFCLRVRHSLVEDGFSTAFEVTNRDEKTLPFCIGAHTAFRCPMGEGETFEDYEILFDQNENTCNLLLNEKGYLTEKFGDISLENKDRFALSYQPFAEIDTIIFRNLASTGVSLRHKEKGHGVHMEFAGFPFMAFWTKGKEKAPFVCVEPWHGCAACENESGRFEEKEECIILQPGETKTFAYHVRVCS